MGPSFSLAPYQKFRLRLSIQGAISRLTDQLVRNSRIFQNLYDGVYRKGEHYDASELAWTSTTPRSWCSEAGLGNGGTSLRSVTSGSSTE